MDFSYTEVQQMLQDQVQKFVQKSYDFETRRKIVDGEAGYSAENWALFAELGWLAVPFSEADGGLGGSAVDLMVMMEEFGKANVVEPFLPSAVLCGGLISRLAEGDQKTRLLEQIMTGQLQLACAFAESGARYNLARVSTTASANGDSIVLEGEKVAVLNAPNADQFLVVAREHGDVADREGLSLFLVDSEAEGVSVQAFANIDGKKSGNLKLDKVQLSAADRIGEAGKLYDSLVAVVDLATVGICAEAVGAMEALLQKTVEYSKTRKQFGVPIATFQALQHRMADMFIECQLARSIVMMAAMKLDSEAEETEKQQAVSAAKSRIARAIAKVGQEAIQIHGGIGTTEELDVGHLFKRVTAIDVMFGNGDYHTERFVSLQSQ